MTPTEPRVAREPVTEAGRRVLPWLAAHYFNGGGLLPAEAHDKAEKQVRAIEAEASRAVLHGPEVERIVRLAVHTCRGRLLTAPADEQSAVNAVLALLDTPNGERP